MIDWCMTHLPAGMTLFLVCALMGCSHLPAAPVRPALNPDEASELALEKCDTDGDSQLNKTEAEQSPGLTSAFDRIDKDQNGELSAEELAERIRYYKTANTTIVSGGMQMLMTGRPLSGATVTLEPEEFLGSAFTPCTGVTNGNGHVSLKGHDAKFPGIYLGMYRLKISKVENGQETIPSKYNTETTLGYEAADDIEFVSKEPTFNLDKK